MDVGNESNSTGNNKDNEEKIVYIKTGGDGSNSPRYQRVDLSQDFSQEDRELLDKSNVDAKVGVAT